MKRLLLALLVLPACTYGFVVTAKSDDMEFTAYVFPGQEEMEAGNFMTKASLEVHCESRQPCKYGNSSLFAIVDGVVESRSYYDSIASMVIDFSEVNLEAGSTLEIPIYWVSTERLSEKHLSELRLEYRGQTANHNKAKQAGTP